MTTHLCLDGAAAGIRTQLGARLYPCDARCPRRVSEREPAEVSSELEQGVSRGRGGTRNNFVAGNGFRIRAGSNHIGFEPLDSQDSDVVAVGTAIRFKFGRPHQSTMRTHTKLLLSCS